MTPAELADALLRAANERDLDAAVALFGVESELCFPRFAPRHVFRGGPELGEFFRWLVEALPQHTVAVDRVVATDATATIEFEIAGTSSHGLAFDNVGALVLDVRDGRIGSARFYVDTADLGRILDVA